MHSRIRPPVASAYEILLGLVALAVVIFLFIAKDKGVTSGVIQAVVAVGTAYFTVAALLRRQEARRFRGGRDVQICDQLAEIVGTRYDRVAAERGLINPSPIPIWWTVAQDGISGPIDDAVGEDASRRRFAPLPGCKSVNSTELREGLVRDLHSVYAGLDSGRIAIVGDPGAGKSAASVFFVLDALAHRKQLPASDREHVPVPFPLTFGDWDPSIQDLQDWLVARFRAEYPEARGLIRGPDIRRLLDRGLITLVLDGLDELPREFRALAVNAVDRQARSCRFVLVSRVVELVAATESGRLRSAAVLKLSQIGPREAAAYLVRRRQGEQSVAWRRLTETIRRGHHRELSAAISSPFVLTVLVDALPAEEDVRTFESVVIGADALTIRDYLMGRVVQLAYRPLADMPGRRDHQVQALHTLGVLAALMGKHNSEQISWWAIDGWLPWRSRFVTNALIVGLAFGVIFAVSDLLMTWWSNIVYVPAGAFPSDADGSAYFTASISSSQLLWEGAIAAVVAIIVGGLPLSLMQARSARLPRQPHWPGLREILSWRSAFLILNAVILGGAVGIGEIYSLQVAFSGPGSSGDSFALDAYLSAFGLAATASGLFCAIIFVPLASAGVTRVDNRRALDPLTTWKKDNRYGWLIGPAVGLWVTSMMYVLLGLWFALIGPIAAAVWGAVFYAATSSLIAVVFTYTWGARLVFVQLHHRFGTPLRLMSFLEDARSRGILRAVGPAYEFRHALLREHLRRGVRLDGRG